MDALRIATPDESCRSRGAPRGCRGRGFTLIELLIVLAIIAGLMALGMVVGRQVVTGGKARVTEQLITSLDQSVDSYVADKGSLPPAVYSHAETVNGVRSVFDFPALDARPGGSRNFPTIIRDRNWFSAYDSTLPSLATYAAVLKQSALAESILKSVPSRFVRTRFLDHWYDGTENATSAYKDILTVSNAAGPIDVQSFEVLDAWGRPIRFVHPGYGGEEFFDGGSWDYYDRTGKAMVRAEGIRRPFNHTVYVRWGDARGTPSALHFRRSYQPFTDAEAASKAPASLTGDADEGICPTRRPYFYSVGPDGDPGRRADNIYTTRPEFPEETAAFDDSL